MRGGSVDAGDMLPTHERSDTTHYLSICLLIRKSLVNVSCGLILLQVGQFSLFCRASSVRSVSGFYIRISVHVRVGELPGFLCTRCADSAGHLSLQSKDLVGADLVGRLASVNKLRSVIMLRLVIILRSVNTQRSVGWLC